MTPKKLSAERLAELRADAEQFIKDYSYAWEAPVFRELLAHCDALAAENQVLRDALTRIDNARNYVTLGEVQDWASTALEQTK